MVSKERIKYIKFFKKYLVKLQCYEKQAMIKGRSHMRGGE
jgi:hypothetical protein